MGVSGLPPLLAQAGTRAKLADLKNKRIAVDASFWLFRGAYCCANELMTHQKTTAYLNYSIQAAQKLRQLGIYLTIVFDGKSLPAKANEHEKRRKLRARAERDHQEHGENVRELEWQIRDSEEGRESQFHDNAEEVDDCDHARLEMARNAQAEAAKRAIKISDEMVCSAMYVLSHIEGVEVLRAPYEADVQLAYLARSGYCYAVLSDDSDLVAHGVARVLMRYDKNSGEALLVEQEKLLQFSVRRFSLKGYTPAMLLEMCVLSGVDYLQSPLGLSVYGANEYIKKYKTGVAAIKFLRNFRRKTIKIPKDYEASFKQALASFRHQRVWSTVQKAVVPLTPVPEDFEGDLDACIGAPMPRAEAAEWISRGYTGSAPIDQDDLDKCISAYIRARPAKVDPLSCNKLPPPTKSGPKFAIKFGSGRTVRPTPTQDVHSQPFDDLCLLQKPVSAPSHDGFKSKLGSSATQLDSQFDSKGGFSPQAASTSFNGNRASDTLRGICVFSDSDDCEIIEKPKYEMPELVRTSENSSVLQCSGEDHQLLESKVAADSPHLNPFSTKRLQAQDTKLPDTAAKVCRRPCSEFLSSDNILSVSKAPPAPETPYHRVPPQGSFIGKYLNSTLSDNSKKGTIVGQTSTTKAHEARADSKMLGISSKTIGISKTRRGKKVGGRGSGSVLQKTLHFLPTA